MSEVVTDSIFSKNKSELLAFMELKGISKEFEENGVSSTIMNVRYLLGSAEPFNKKIKCLIISGNGFDSFTLEIPERNGLFTQFSSKYCFFTLHDGKLEIISYMPSKSNEKYKVIIKKISPIPWVGWSWLKEPYSTICNE